MLFRYMYGIDSELECMEVWQHGCDEGERDSGRGDELAGQGAEMRMMGHEEHW